MIVSVVMVVLTVVSLTTIMVSGAGVTTGATIVVVSEVETVDSSFFSSPEHDVKEAAIKAIAKNFFILFVVV
ncbi:MAG: hypothetical protein ABIT58_05730 [Ferruginibacter sp.]